MCCKNSECAVRSEYTPVLLPLRSAARAEGAPKGCAEAIRPSFRYDYIVPLPTMPGPAVYVVAAVAVIGTVAAAVAFKEVSCTYRISGS